MLGFMTCVVEAISMNGVQGLMELVPGGPYVCKIGADAIRRYREKHARKLLEEEVKELVLAKADVALAAAKRAVEEAAPHLPPREKELVLQFVTAIPEAARQSLKRKDDPTGTSLPFGYAIDESSDLVKLLPQHPPRFVPGDWVPGREGNWTLDRRLGGGGFGEVWLARHAFNRKEKPRAVKFCTDPAARARLVEHEKDVIVRVMEHVGHHDNIVPLLEYHLSGAAPWLMYEFVAGGTLADAVLGWHALTPAERFNRTVPILYTVAHAVGCGHAVRPAVVHRDLKPANVLMAGDVPRITDYGIGGVAVAFQVAEERAGTLTGKINRLPAVLSGAYSLMYSSPQQRAGDRPDPRDDVHALGVMAYQMLVGRVDKEVKGNWQDRLAADGVPTALISLIGRSASDEADDRPADARAWEAALADFLLPVAADIDEALPAPARAKPAAVPRAAPVPPKSAAVPRAAPVPPKPAAAARAPEPAKPPARAPGEGVEFPLPRGLTMAFCWIPPGTARLGSPPAEQAAVERALGARPDWLAAEGEARRGAYTTAGFWLGKRPVTQDEWHALTGEMPSYFRAGGGGAGEVKGLDTTRFPVEQVSWDAICGAGGFLAKLNALGGTKRVFGAAVTFALPHEDAWEYACRGGRGNGQPFYFGPELNGARANVDGNNPFGTAAKGPYAKRPTPVGRYEPAAPHPWGLCDLHGNVWEWCANRHERTRYPVLRGGSWNDSACHGRAASRNGGAPAVASWNIGFRVVAAG